MSDRTRRDGATHVLAHISDTHFLGSGLPLHGKAQTDARVERALVQLERSGIAIDAMVFTGDIADLGEEAAYSRIRNLVAPYAQRMGAEVVWVMGNHDKRAEFRSTLLDEEPSGESVDRVIDLDGLRLVALDTSVPGYHHGELSDDQLAWLRGVLAEPAPHGTLVALHHPPIPTAVPLMPILELTRQELLADAIAGTDVRAILGGHLHYTTHSLFAGVPISVVASTCYTMDETAEPYVLLGNDGGQSFNLVHVYEDRVVHSAIPIGVFTEVTTFPPDLARRLEVADRDEQLAAFSRQPD